MNFVILGMWMFPLMAKGENYSLVCLPQMAMRVVVVYSTLDGLGPHLLSNDELSTDASLSSIPLMGQRKM